MHDELIPLIDELELVYMQRVAIEHESQARTGPLAAKELDLRDQIKQIMVTTGAGSQKSSSRQITVSTSIRKDYEVADEDSLTDYLKNRGIYDEYTTLSLNKAELKKLAKKDDLPGMRMVEKAVISVTPAKDDEPVERMAPEESPIDFRNRVRGNRDAE